MNQYPDLDIVDALAAAGLSHLTHDRGGLQMKILENGDNLSAGEKQLVTIARAILKNSKIVLLDEATSSIDVVTEKQVQKVIEECFAHSTVITIAHRIHTIQNCDRILVMDRGMVAEFDSPARLVANPKSIFAGLWEEARKHDLSHGV
jgi:ATP-binding cassette subfamily C (CFTR/MRP) protein 2